MVSHAAVGPCCRRVSHLLLTIDTMSNMPPVIEATPEVWEETRNSVAMHFLGKTSDEFVRLYNEGAYDEDVPGLMAVLALFPELD